MKVAHNEYLIFYDPETPVGKKTFAYLRSEIPLSRIKQLIVQKDVLTGKLWKEMLAKLNMKPEDIIDTTHPLYEEKLQDFDLSEADWLVVLKHDPELLIAPIVINEHKAILCKNPSDVLKLF